jgi:DNA mismatch repair protein MutS
LKTAVTRRGTVDRQPNRRTLRAQQRPLPCRDRIQIITGPNMSGKSTYLRQVALITLMAQIGSFVPAESAQIGLVDRIFTRIGAHDELHAGRSTFMVEMVEAAEISTTPRHRSLLILDEIGRGTSTYDGLAIAWAMVEYLHNHPRLKPRTLFATHYHELVGLADLLPLVPITTWPWPKKGTVVFLHQIVPGGADQSYGIHVAQLAGLPRDVINRANEILQELERHAPTTAVEPSRFTASQQMALFPETSPILEELEKLDVNALTPLEAINKLYEWKRKFTNEVLAYHVADETQERLNRLLALNEAGMLSPHEQLELDERDQIEHILIMLKARITPAQN